MGSLGSEKVGSVKVRSPNGDTLLKTLFRLRYLIVLDETWVKRFSARQGVRGILFRGGKVIFLPEEGREGGEKSARSAPAGPGARTRDLPRAR